MQSLMTRNVGIYRNGGAMAEAEQKLQNLRQEYKKIGKIPHWHSGKAVPTVSADQMPWP